MTRKTLIDFATATWPVVTGCSKDGNKGCENCYAAFQAATRLKHLPHYVGLAGFDKFGGAQWTGKVRCNDNVLEEPRSTRKPQRYFVAPRGDLFHPHVPDEFLDKVFSVMASCQHHTFMIFTKRAERRLEYLSAFKSSPQKDGYVTRNGVPASYRADDGSTYKGPIFNPGRWPLPNVWQITSVWDQESADRLIPPTLETPSAVRGVSIAPMLGPVDLTALPPLPEFDLDHGITNALDGCVYGDDNMDGAPVEKLDWVIVEGESGKHARATHPDWVRQLRDQCDDASVPFYFKQWGEWVPHKPAAGGDLGGDVRKELVQIVHPTGQSDVEVSELTGGRSTIPGSRYMARIGKRLAGRLLDGREHLEMPK